jgi:hypothetical protein
MQIIKNEIKITLVHYFSKFLLLLLDFVLMYHALLLHLKRHPVQ